MADEEINVDPGSVEIDDAGRVVIRDERVAEMFKKFDEEARARGGSQGSFALRHNGWDCACAS
jgi:hypothetical protein